jgi:AAA15 family ATPase/GTPase
MRIKELQLKNYNVIKSAVFADLGPTVVIAGPNGVGKTTVKNAIIQTFQNGNPPPGCRIVLEATNEEERAQLNGDDQIALPNSGFFNSVFRKNRKKISAKTRLIHINSDRQIQNVNFSQYGLNQLGDPEGEEIQSQWSLDVVNNRFSDVINTLYRMKTKLITEYGLSAVNAFEANEGKTASIQRIKDPAEPFIKIFNELLYPKRMAPIKPSSSSIRFFDEESIERDFSQLSSGEKEVIAITFDIQLQNPEDCIIVIDEPELHLHPELSYRLIKNLNSIGKNNQYILFTHSADIIGSSFDTGVWFLRPKSRTIDENQVKRIDRETLAELSDVPNVREAIGVLSLGKKLVFVEGEDISIDRSVFSSIALSSKKDIAIIPSSNCRMIENLSHFSEVLSRGIFGLELKMIRDRDGLTESKIAELKTKSNDKLIVLPFYHIENVFLDPDALAASSETILSASKRKSRDQISAELLRLARQQIGFCAMNYVRQEIHLSSPKLDLSSRLASDGTYSVSDLVSQMSTRRSEVIQRINSNFGDAYIKERLEFWISKLELSVANGWSEDARKYFYGKRLLAEINKYLMGSSHVTLWEQILYSKDPRCLNATKEIRQIIDLL